MSYKATGWAYDLPISGPRKGVLVVLADMADEAFSCYPGQQKIVHMSGFSEKTVRRALASLEEDGLISREQRHGRNGYRTSDRYILHVGLGLPVTEPTGQSDHRSESPSLPVTLTLPTGQSDRAEEPSVEPLDESPDLRIGDEPVRRTTELMFEKFWEVWKHKKSKLDALKAWTSTLNSVKPAEREAFADRIIGVVPATFEQWVEVEKRSKSKIPYPATWLRAGGYDDPIEEAEPVDTPDPWAGKRRFGGRNG